MSVYQIYVEKKPEFAVEALGLKSNIQDVLGMQQIQEVRVIHRYLVEHISSQDLDSTLHTVFSEPPLDQVSHHLPNLDGYHVIAVEYLPGQYDQRADSCAQCISLSTGKERPLVQTCRIILIKGQFTSQQLQTIQSSLINPVESRLASLEIPNTLESSYSEPSDIPVWDGFCQWNRDQLQTFHTQQGLAMDLDDLLFTQNYFQHQEQRDPTQTEIRVIDTYWSDHCRHTTFSTQLDRWVIDDPEIEQTAQMYFNLRKKLYATKEKPMTLMDLATIGTKALKSEGLLHSLDESEEINACSVKITVDCDGKEEDWLLMFKNETHNHPTEIEPFGGAATCLGGAIRDPLSGRSYVYQAMRITGSANPLQPVFDTLPGKLPQRKIAQTSAAGYSSYGNQIGLATGHVSEIYHPGYMAKHMELGAVLGAAPAQNVRREIPCAQDVVILLGGKTGRDGCGGATGSSKSHTTESLDSCGAEVQKGNPPEERKIQRLFRNPQATQMIRRCNDFGAGGVCVSIGELADGLTIDLDQVPKKYAGLSGTELAISESQERMSVVVSPQDVNAFIALAREENLEASPVAVIHDEPRLKMNWKNQTIVNLSREFLNSNGAPKHSSIQIPLSPVSLDYEDNIQESHLKELLSSLACCSQKGLIERFDSTIGAGTVLMPFGGVYQLTPSQSMVAKIPVEHAQTNTVSIMSWGFSPEITQQNPYVGAQIAVIESVAKLIAVGGTRQQCWLTLQEYFERLGNDPLRWGKPTAALLGALKAQVELQVAAIGGKDSMSGSFESLDVPPTLVSFAVGVSTAPQICSNEFKAVGNYVYLVSPQYNSDSIVPEYSSLRDTWDWVEQLMKTGQVVSSWALGQYGTADAIPKMCFGNHLSFQGAVELSSRPLFGSFLLETTHKLDCKEARFLGEVVQSSHYSLILPSQTISLQELEDAWQSTLEPVYPVKTKEQSAKNWETFSFDMKIPRLAKNKVASPRVVIPVFPGTNCEYDTARAFELSGATPQIFVVKNQTAQDISQSVAALEKMIQEAQMIALPGGFSGGDEPDGSAKFMVSFFRNPAIREAVMELLSQRDGLMCGICNGFQSLIKLGLVPYGEIRDIDEHSPTLTYNSIGRHQSSLVQTRISSNLSPWLSRYPVGTIHTVAISHGEGRFIASPDWIKQLAEKGQIATQYVDHNGIPTADIRYNPNNSFYGVEAITSPDGRVLGKMAHSERFGKDLYKNVPGDKWMDIFSGAVDYYR